MRPLSYDRRLQFLALAAGFPRFLYRHDSPMAWKLLSGTVWTLAFLIFLSGSVFAFSLRHRVVFSLQTLSNLLAALREEDFSLRARGARSDDAMGEVMIEVNALSEVLRQQRLGALEANALLRTVMEEIDLAVFTFDALPSVEPARNATSPWSARLPSDSRPSPNSSAVKPSRRLGRHGDGIHRRMTRQLAVRRR